MRKLHTRVRLPEDQVTRLRELSAQSGFTVSDLIRACITRALPYVEDKVKVAPRATPQTSSVPQNPSDTSEV